ncbi:PREDICTED: cell division cycle-associated protein 2 isoform X2 [Miniopterus natalensis]|uniref:cell division cycle-associated protein 2 isoform X2 n=1 Tax=Miniopterus natalensis TaxID=291302 RepID=UPI0007A71AC4|nr:PREDICTED: cell division cycle-associated protein 2 isoform X2 [Miniopterus natalensis]
MDTNSKDPESPETKESAINAENPSFTLGSENLVTSQKHAAEVTPNPSTPENFKSPLDFSTVTVEQLGITSESFVKNSSGKSSSYLKKSRRRSTVGVRGSPETNNLIRFIAQQRNLKNAENCPLTQNFPFLGSPVLYRNVSSLRERISAFQSAFQSVKEKEKITDRPEFSEAEGEFETTGLTKKESLGECQQSAFPAQLSKRQRISSQSNSDENITNAIDLQMFNVAAPSSTDRTCAVETSLVDLSEKFSGPGLTQSECLVEESIPFSECTGASAGIKVADRVGGKGSGDAVSLDKFAEVSTGTAPEVRALVTPLCKRDIPPSGTSVLRSVLKKPSAKLCLESLQEHCDNLCDNGSHPSLISTLANCCKEQKAEGQENYKVPAFVNMRKRKRVTFGEDLSPEVFDESLPANTPLRKGQTPVRKKDLSTVTPLLLEQSPVPEQLPQPNFDDKGENLENIEPLQVSFAVASPLSKSSISENLSGTDTFSSANNQEKISPCKDGRRTRTSNRRRLASCAEDSVCSLFNTEAQPCKEKKVRRRKSQESKRADRILPKKNPVLKSCRKKKGRRKKGVEKSLYGERDIASKKPLLSPIPELPEVSEVSPSVPVVRRVYAGDFSSHGELEEMKPPGRRNPLPQHSDLQMNQEFNKYSVSEFCSSYIKSSLSLINATFDQDSNINTARIHARKIIPKAEIKLEGDLETGTKNENSRVSCASVTETPIVSDGPQPDFVMQSKEFAAAGQNVENPFQSFKVSGDTKHEQQDDLVATDGKLQTKPFLSGSEKERGDSDDVFIDNRRGGKSQSGDLRRNSAASSSGVSCERKHRRRSVCDPDGHSLHLEKDGIHRPSCSMGSSVEMSLETSELCKDLSDSIEQTFLRTNRETKVRRSTRLQKDLENEGLIWISLPFSSTSCPSQRTKRRTVHTFDSRGLESVSPRKNTVSFRRKPPLCSTSDQENSEGFAASSSSLPGNRRKSFCTSALANTGNTPSEC